MVRKTIVPVVIVLACFLSLGVVAQEEAKPAPEQPKSAPPAAAAGGCGCGAAEPLKTAEPGIKASEPGPKPAEAAPAPAAVGADELKSVEEAYSLKLKGLEEKVNELKERVFRSKARLLLLQETVLTGKISGAKIHLVHRNEMGGSYKLESVAYALDGAPVFSKVDQGGDLDSQEEFDILPTSNMVAGNHSLSVYLIYRGSGFGLFSYLDGYKFKIRSSYTFYIEEGKVTKVKVVAFEKGGFTTDLKDRPSVRFDVEIKPDVEEAKQAAKPAGTTENAEKK
jgi:hypothetical protein